MKVLISFSSLALACCMPVFAQSSQSPPSKDTVTAVRAAGSVVNASRPPDSLSKVVTSTAPMVGPCSLGDPAFSNCLGANAKSMVREPADRAAQVFRFSIRTNDGSLTRRTVLATTDTSEAEAGKMALKDIPGGVIEGRL
jgi:hypothetical protein